MGVETPNRAMISTGDPAAVLAHCRDNADGVPTRVAKNIAVVASSTGQIRSAISVTAVA